MRSIIVLITSVIATAAMPVKAAIDESVFGDFPAFANAATLLDGSTIVPGCTQFYVGGLLSHDGGGSDVDYIRFNIPFLSSDTWIDVDVIGGESMDSYMEAGYNPVDPVNGFGAGLPPNGSLTPNDDDGDAPPDNTCGTDGNPLDSLVYLGPTVADAMIYLGITGAGDPSFSGTHNKKFDYRVSIVTVPEPTSLALLAFGALFVARRNKRRQAA